MPNGVRPIIGFAVCILLAGYAAGRLDAATHRWIGLATTLVALVLGVLAAQWPPRPPNVPVPPAPAGDA